MNKSRHSSYKYRADKNSSSFISHGNNCRKNKKGRKFVNIEYIANKGDKISKIIYVSSIIGTNSMSGSPIVKTEKIHITCKKIAVKLDGAKSFRKYKENTSKEDMIKYRRDGIIRVINDYTAALAIARAKQKKLDELLIKELHKRKNKNSLRDD